MAVELDLNRLNATERAILALLAQGHTVKSIAVATGRSEGAVNERLRDARRKTGVSSSRELARLVRERENRDEEIGIPEPAPVAPGLGSVPPWARWERKVLLMTLPLIALAAASLMLHGAVRQAPVPPQLPQLSSSDPGLVATETAIRSVFAREARYPAWATAAEATLRRRYLAISGLDAATLSIVCHTTLCEVSGRSAAAVGAATGKRGAEDLASPALRSSVRGLHADVAHLSTNGDGPEYQFAFNALWQRVQPD